MSKKSKEMFKRDIPFTLASLEAKKHFIEIYPKNIKWLESLNNLRPVAAKKLYEVLVENPSPENEDLDAEGNCISWGLSLPKISGLSAGERILLSQSASRQQALYEYFRVVDRIHQKTGIPYEELQPMLDNPLQHIDKIGDFVGDLTSVANKLSSQASNKKEVVTVVLKERLIASWEEEDTNKLCDGLFAAIVDYIESEQGNWEVIDQGEDQEQGEPLNNTSKEESLN